MLARRKLPLGFLGGVDGRLKAGQRLVRLAAAHDLGRVGPLNLGDRPAGLLERGS
jgi:hypothetical protein